jgi:hypothetical protein
MTPILELHWGWGRYTGNSAGCSDVHTGCQKPMPNMQYTPSFWASVANTGYEVAGMQDLVDAIRDTGAKNSILVGGLAYSNDLSQWLTYKPTDPAANLAAAWHVYNVNCCQRELLELHTRPGGGPGAAGGRGDRTRTPARTASWTRS